METLSQRFMEALAVPRDHLYALALGRGGSAAEAERALVAAARMVFAQAAVQERVDIAGAVERGLVEGGSAGETASLAEHERGNGSAGGQGVAQGVTMPADVWARLAAAVQVEAARSTRSGMLADDSDLLKPDPVLAPRRKVHKVDEEAGAAVSTVTFVLASLAVGVALTVYILTRPAGNGGRPSAPASPATTLLIRESRGKLSWRKGLYGAGVVG